MWPSQVGQFKKKYLQQDIKVLGFTLLTDTNRDFAISFHFPHT